MVLCAGLFASVAFTGCKSSESAYKKAYEKAKAQETAQQPIDQPHPEEVLCRWRFVFSNSQC